MYRDRHDAGRALARRLETYASKGRPDDFVVLALPRGGVPVAYEIARHLGLPLDVSVVRKLGAPGREELAIGAVAANGVRVSNDDVIAALGIRPEQIEEVERRERGELERRSELYREGRPALDVHGRKVILVDDGLATGSTMHAAVLALRRQSPAEIVLAVPVGSRQACAMLAKVADQVVCLSAPPAFYAISRYYDDFSQTTDDDVQRLLRMATRSSWQVPASSPRVSEASLNEALRGAAQPVRGVSDDYNGIVDQVGDARLVLLGAATHGTREFYAERARLTRRLIDELGFAAVIVEADWPDAYQVNRFVRGLGDAGNPRWALRDFKRFPSWTWRNHEVVRFVAWLRERNDARPERERVGFYGMDLYGLRSSAALVVDYLERVDPEAAARARYRYGSLDAYGEDPQHRDYAARFGLTPLRLDQVVTQLVDMQRASGERAREGLEDADEAFFLDEHARAGESAETYYRAMLEDDVSAWNLRDRHMADMVSTLLAHLERRLGRDRARVAVWAHNSHLGDARATSLSLLGEVNVGQLLRERFGREVASVGMMTYRGQVAAASRWDGPVEVKTLRPALPESWEAALHAVAVPCFTLGWRRGGALEQQLSLALLTRGIGLIYRRDTERISHYFEARLAAQFDALLYVDETHAVQPLEVSTPRRVDEESGSFPSTV